MTLSWNYQCRITFGSQRWKRAQILRMEVGWIFARRRLNCLEIRFTQGQMSKGGLHHHLLWTFPNLFISCLMKPMVPLTASPMGSKSSPTRRRGEGDQLESTSWLVFEIWKFYFLNFLLVMPWGFEFSGWIWWWLASGFGWGLTLFGCTLNFSEKNWTS